MKYDRVRAGGICIHDNRILLIHRINLEKLIREQEYYVIPGGGVETGEKVKDAVIREMKEGVHFYKPMWVELSELKNIILYPTPLKQELIKKFSNK